MKKLLPAILIVAFLVSCSDNDSSPDNGNNVPVDPDTGIFTAIKETAYNNFMTPYETLYEYEDGKLRRMTRSNEGDVAFYIDYGYDNDGLLASAIMTAYGNLPEDSETYTYDSQGRLTHIEYTRNGQPLKELTYVYEGQIATGTMTAPGGDVLSTKVYTLNSNNLVVSEFEAEWTFGDWMHEVAYNGFNATTATNYFGTTTYTYDEEHDASILGITDGNGSFKANAALRSYDMQMVNTAIATNYILTESYDNADEEEPSYTTVNTYTFSPGGRPVTMTAHRNNQLDKEVEYIYEAE